MNVNEEILLKNGFIKEERFLGCPITYRKWTEDKFPYKFEVTLENEYNNSPKEHHVHIDNCACSSVGALEFDTVEQFNLLMEALGSGFRLKV